MTPLFVVVLATSASVAVLLVLAVRWLQRRELEERVDRAVFESWDESLAASRSRDLDR